MDGSQAKNRPGILNATIGFRTTCSDRDGQNGVMIHGNVPGRGTGSPAADVRFRVSRPLPGCFWLNRLYKGVVRR